MVLNCEDAFEVLRGVPIFCWVLVSVVLLSADVRPTGAVHEFKAYRMQHFDLHGMHYGMVTSEMTIMCMHTFVYICICTHTRVCVCTCLYTYEHISAHAYNLCTCTRTHQQLCIHAHTSDRTHITLLAHISVYMDMCTNAHTPGSRSALVNMEVRSEVAAVLNRKCIVIRWSALSSEKFLDIIHRGAGAILILLPSEWRGVEEVRRRGELRTSVHGCNFLLLWKLSMP